MFLNFQTDRSEQTVLTQIGLLSLSRVYTVCHYICIFWTYYSMVRPPCSNFRVITANYLGVQIFRNFTVICLVFFHLAVSRDGKSICCQSYSTRPACDRNSVWTVSNCPAFTYHCQPARIPTPGTKLPSHATDDYTHAPSESRTSCETVPTSSLHSTADNAYDCSPCHSLGCWGNNRTKLSTC